jgi:predicted enzyme related to lactoylglutathione lyase
MATNPVVHLELHTGDLPRAASFYWELCGWRPEHVKTGGSSYLALPLGNGNGLGGGVVECATSQPLWLPYVEVPEIAAATDQARQSGAQVMLEPREGPAGWRSVVETAAAGQVGLWQQKR